MTSALDVRHDAQMFGKDLTPAKVQMKKPGVVWGGVLMEVALSRNRKISLRLAYLGG